ncbi:hypothetical protein [Eoetvoesiella caeni]|uniref:Uncharacterized protein n=1 Tax=Eoetvoesiella caeni TaxID=645616 RepID=A0A366H0E4_9BURK|nr:hypothetical protein [Eoetvoesiella caeni]MCI2811302.1 hypothetical protein [Eoetvoesiella caeni]NYT57199.1 hypothetical protein [Eoetvoesiella caeni]RBP33628.1 hypothetical protein DFR37_12619 [Eoetvoesiella caeni]
MKQSDLNHLRRLVAWIRVEIGQTPEELEVTMKSIADKLGHPEIDDDAKRRLVEAHDKARQVPIYVRNAVKALDRYIGEHGEIVEAEDSSPIKQLEN